MKKISIFILLPLMVMAMAACGNKTAPQESNDSLQTALTSSQSDYQELQEFLSVIATGLDSITAQESDILYTSRESPVPNQQRIREQLDVLKQKVESQRAKIDNLERKLKADSKNAAMMKSVINMLKGQLAEKTTRIAELQEELNGKELTIQELSSRVEDLTSQAARREETIASQKDMISDQDNLLNTGYVKIGTKSELKDAGLLTGGFLKKTKVDVSSIDKSLFRSIDIREETELVINSKRVRIMTQMPEESYTMEEKDGKTVLHINDPQRFWSISKFLIVTID